MGLFLASYFSMSFLLTTLTLIETRLQTLIEGSLARLFPTYDIQKELAQQSVHAIKAEIRTGPKGALVAPNLFTVFLPAEQALVLQQDESFLDLLSRSLSEAVRESGLSFAAPPSVKVLPDPEQAASGIQVIAQFSLVGTEKTSTLHLAFTAEKNNPIAFLIVNGTRMFPLEKTVTNIGRQKGNQLVIEDTRVSRHHAQLRMTKAQFIIFDLGSAGGTYVNGVRISERQLFTGDVISIGGVPLVFGLESRADLDQTQEIPPPTPAENKERLADVFDAFFSDLPGVYFCGLGCHHHMVRFTTPGRNNSKPFGLLRHQAADRGRKRVANVSVQ